MLRKTLIAICSGGLSLGCALLVSKASFVEALTISILISGVSLVVDYLVEVESTLKKIESQSAGEIAAIADRMRAGNQSIARQVEEAHAKLFEHIDGRLSLLMAVPELFNLQRTRPTTAQSIVKVIRDAYSYERRSSPLSTRFLERKTTDFSGLLHGLRAGHAVYAGEDFDWMMTLTGTCERTIDATSSTATDSGGRRRYSGGFWDSNQGLRYMEAQREAVQRRGVKIRRLFILEFAPLTADEFYIALCERQRRAGIEIRYLTRDMCRPELLNQLDDFIVFDNEVCYETIPTPTPGEDRPTVSRTEVVVARDTVNDRVSQFTRLWDAALPCPDPEGEGSDGVSESPTAPR
ncbi:hypothetical protein KDL01_21815 [Actinospica durhamensis]|uniref:DUF6879 domain-containing protein n=1 Tax=Actinospica durhamensis TaxID=1508375 RepID=A0A941ET17_9ACTN|nr:DUF6879 family protein [Actinospica durhamensis]MBR7835927.1 hypothetical protein [Actinospica durhamensis]